MRFWDVGSRIEEPIRWNSISIIGRNNRWNRKVDYQKSGVQNFVSRTIVSSKTIIEGKKVTCSSFVALVNPSEVHNCYNYNCSYYSIIQTKSSLKDLTETCITVCIFMYQNITTSTRRRGWPWVPFRDSHRPDKELFDR